ncbi:MAG: hypothetical protein ACI4WX_11815 [Aristaeellaceae bacterium]
MEKVCIEIYDEDGVLRESVSGRMEVDEIKASMLEAIQNDGIPVLRRVGKTKESSQDKESKQKTAEKWDMPLAVTIEYDDIRFSAGGRMQDVLAAEQEFLDEILKE